MSLIYNFPLTDWISAGLHKGTLNEVIHAITENRPIEPYVKPQPNNRQYIEKIMREEVVKQFSDAVRPKLEIILNSIDARPASLNPPSKDYEIKVAVGWSKFIAEDNGTGMSLDKILRLLIIPFNTEKEGIEEIGRFGVGFLSAFNYCLKLPKKTELELETRTGDSGYNVTFYATGPEVGNLRMRLKKNRKISPPGTKVTIRRNPSDAECIVHYLTQNLAGVLPYKAKIRINRRLINEDSNNKWYSSPVALDVDGRIITQPVGFKNQDEHITLTAQGVQVKRFCSQNISGAVISFPPAAKLVEGRDEFKIDDNYRRCVAGAFKALEQYIQEENRSKEKGRNLEAFRRQMADLIPSLMSAFSLTNLKEIPSLPELKESLFPGKRYILTSSERDHLLPFVGSSLNDLSAIVSTQAHAYWRAVYETYSGVANEFLKPIKTFRISDLLTLIKQHPSFYPNIYPLVKEAAKVETGRLKDSSDSYTGISFVEIFPAGESPVLIEDSHIFLNLRHQYLFGESTSIKAYAVLSEYFVLSKAQSKSRFHKPGITEQYVRDTLLSHLGTNPEITLQTAPEETAPTPEVKV